MPPAKRTNPRRLTFDKNDIKPLLAAVGECLRRDAGARAVLTGGAAGERLYVAQRLANEGRRSLLRIDLSEVASRYIDETEKNLRKVFQRARSLEATLLFEEADALVGRRAEVDDPADRYSQATQYLLRAMRRYKGLCLVSMQSDPARYPELARAADLVVAFDAPEEAARPTLDRRPPPDESVRPLTNQHFRVIVGDQEIGICELCGLTSESEVVRVKDPKQNGLLDRKEPGETRYHNLVLRRGITRSKVLYQWRQNIIEGQADRRDVTIHQLAGGRGKPVNSWKLSRCWPCRWSGPPFDALGGGIGFEEVELCYERFQWL